MSRLRDAIENLKRLSCDPFKDEHDWTIAEEEVAKLSKLEKVTEAAKSFARDADEVAHPMWHGGFCSTFARQRMLRSNDALIEAVRDLGDGTLADP